MKLEDDEAERGTATTEALVSGPLIGAVLRASQRLVEAALGGVSDRDLVALFGRILTEAGLDIVTIEVACDAVDPERAHHFIRWRRNVDETEGGIFAHHLFQNMLKQGATELRLSAESKEFVRVVQGASTDAIAFANHLAPDVTVGFFDDVMSLFVTEKPAGFSAADIDLLRLVTPVFALALGARLNAAAARALLQTYLGSDAATALLRGRVGLGAVEEIRAVVIYCDLFGFTSLTEMLDAKSLIEHLNLFFETVTLPASRAGGQVAGHVGDAAVMFFPILDPARERSVCAAAVKAALDGQEALELLNAMRPGRLAAPLRARLGIDIGEVVHGNIGSAGRFSFTIIGTPVNRAARLQALAKDLRAALLMTSSLAEAAGVQCRSFGKRALRGFDRPVEVVGFDIADDTNSCRR
jgi:class 3 adenylate cyclase